MRAADAQQQAQRVEQLRQEMSTAAGAAAQAKADLLAAKATASSVEKAARAAREEQRQQVAALEQQQKAAKAEEVAADRVKARQAQVCCVPCHVCVLCAGAGRQTHELITQGFLSSL